MMQNSQEIFEQFKQAKKKGDTKKNSIHIPFYALS